MGDAAADPFEALGDPTRRRILELLGREPQSVAVLAHQLPVSRPAVSRHLKVLTDAGLIERTTDAQWRRCALRGEGMRAAADWIEEYRRFWEQAFDKLEAFLKSTAPKPERKPKRGKNVRRR